MAAIPENLAQTELFGHEKGAFTGADRQRIGYIESANGGTLFLDEIGDLPQQIQGNLLRFLQEGVVTRVGGNEVIPVNVRVIAATHVNLEEAVSAGRFREDLYYRLNVLQLEMPPLRDRGGDIEYLAEQFFLRFCRTSRCTAKGLSQRAIAVMKEHHWPGNIREMINRIQRAVVMCSGQLIHPEDLGLERREASRRIETLSAARNKIEKRLVQQALLDTRHNLSETSRVLGISRVTLYKLIDKYQLVQEGRAA
jgi:DNA-binding NtrC family response regulator